MRGRKVSHQRPPSRLAAARLPATPSKPSPLTASHGHAPEASPDPTSSVPRSLGRPLEPPVRAFMEERFGHDFRQVRIHADPAAARTAHHLNANAYTVGPHIAFASGAYAPGTVAGR